MGGRVGEHGPPIRLTRARGIDDFVGLELGSSWARVGLELGANGARVGREWGTSGARMGHEWGVDGTVDNLSCICYEVLQRVYISSVACA